MHSVSSRTYSNTQSSPILSPKKTALFGHSWPDSVKITDPIKVVTDASFSKEIIEASKKQPVLVTFYASWCGPCHEFAKRAKELAKQYQGRVCFVKVLVSDFANGRKMPVNTQRFKEFGGATYPTVMLFAKGQPQPVFSYYERENGVPMLNRLIPEQTTGIPSCLTDEEFKTLLDKALPTVTTPQNQGSC
jgi:thioredoxin-like negative regulator of GroEL